MLKNALILPLKGGAPLRALNPLSTLVLSCVFLLQVMVSCARVITILSPNFLADEACLEQYNIALCCTRNMKRDYLAPFYALDVEIMPTYMCLIQYFDCRYVYLLLFTNCATFLTNNNDNINNNNNHHHHHSADGPVGVCEYTEEGTVHLSLVVLDGWQLFTDQES